MGRKEGSDTKEYENINKEIVTGALSKYKNLLKNYKKKEIKFKMKFLTFSNLSEACILHKDLYDSI